MERRRFIVKAAGVLAAASATAVVDAPHVIAQPKVQWRMSTTWTPPLDVMQGTAQLKKFAAEVSRRSRRRAPWPGRSTRPTRSSRRQLPGRARISEGAYHQFVAL